MTTSILRALLAATLLYAPISAQDAETSQAAPSDEVPWGHSAHGDSYDQGPRQRPWLMEGIGSTPFPITSSHPEVQQWFDQAIALMHGFWGYEAERSLRWCLKLDPDCAMAYWALARISRRDPARRSSFLEEASALKDKVTPRERAYIEVSEAFDAARKFGPDEEEAAAEARREATAMLDRLAMDYPDDVEAKALYWRMIGEDLGPEVEGNRYALEAVLDDILEVNPDHVGALHYRVHTWDGKDGHFAVDTCMKLGSVAPNCGHLLHMPGHVLSGIGLWHEAAISMDQATRVEKEYMNVRMVLPEDNWNYGHNLDYLCYIQEQLGMVDQALLGAEQLLRAPAFADNPAFGIMVKIPTVRALIKYERWDELLEEGRIPWDLESPPEQFFSLYAQARALIGSGQLEDAAGIVEKLEAMLKTGGPAGPPSGPSDDPKEAASNFMAKAAREKAGALLPELQALLMIAEGDALAGVAMLTEAAAAQEDRWQNDPPAEPGYLYNLLGDTYLKMGAASLAIDCYEKTLETVFHDGFALAGLVAAHAQLGNQEKAQSAMARLQVVWSDAERPNRWLAAAEATGIVAAPHLDSPVEQRNYKTEVLDVQGPSLWEPSALPNLTATNANGKSVQLSDYRGKNVLLIFYLGEQCVHCIEQITLAQEHTDEFADLDTVVLAVSRDTVERIADQQLSLDVILLSDTDFKSARQFQSYDDFEDLELHSTFLINREGQLHWSRIGGDPFTDFNYILKELKHMNELAQPLISEADPSAGSQGADGPDREPNASSGAGSL